jgi:predicted dehydrogenase
MRLGIMSFAHLHAEGYIHNMRAVPDVEMIGFADEDADRGRHFSALYDTPWFDSYEKLLAEKPDGVVICSENAHHCEMTEMAAAAGAHVLSEKPLATTLDDAQRMIDVCEQAEVQLMTAFPMRFSAPIIEIKKLVESGELGHIFGCNTTNQGQLPRLHTAYPRNWFVDKKLAGGGAAADHTVHVADLLRWFLGCEVVEVYAELNGIFYSNENLDVETGGLVMLTFENGTFATIDCSWSKPPNYSTWGGLTMELVSERGLASVDAFKQTMPVYAQGAARPHLAYWGSDANQGMIDEFVAAIRDHRTPSITGYDGYKAVEIVQAVYRSAESGQPVALPLK